MPGRPPQRKGFTVEVHQGEPELACDQRGCAWYVALRRHVGLNEVDAMADEHAKWHRERSLPGAGQ